MESETEKLLRNAEARYDKGDYSGAVQEYTRILEMNPDDGWSYWERGLARKACGDLDGALKDFDRALEKDPKNSFAYYQRAMIREKKKDKSGAEEDYQKARELRGSMPVPVTRKEKMSRIKYSAEKDGRSGMDYS